MAGDGHLVWVLLGPKVGDNAQLEELASRIAGRIVNKQLSYRFLHKLPNLLLGRSLISLDKRKSDVLEPPWPDLVIGAGRRSVPVARWIQKRSAGHTKLVQVGRPRAPVELFDLVITTPQYGLPLATNVIELSLPMAKRVALAADELSFWKAQFGDLPEPRIVVLVGGPMAPLVMGTDEATNIASSVTALAREAGGSLIVIGSPRTPLGMIESIGTRIKVPHQLYPWRLGIANPYQAALHLAQRIVVTSDSISMIGEALNTCKPVDVFRLPLQRQWQLPLHRWPFTVLVNWGVLARQRNVDGFVSRLIKLRHVRAIGQPEFERVLLKRQEGEVVERMKALLKTTSHPSGS